jgi:hypothetical protein
VRAATKRFEIWLKRWLPRESAAPRTEFLRDSLPWASIRGILICHFWAVKPRRSGRGYKARLSESVILNFFRPQDLWAGSPKVKPLSFSSAEVKRLWEEPIEDSRKTNADSVGILAALRRGGC